MKTVMTPQQQMQKNLRRAKQALTRLSAEMPAWLSKEPTEGLVQATRRLAFELEGLAAWFAGDEPRGIE